MTRKVQIRFDGGPGPIAGRFVEVEDAETGESISIGDWKEDPDGSGDWLLMFDYTGEVRRNTGRGGVQ